MEPLRQLADRLDEAAAAFTGARPGTVDPAQPAGEAPGTPGEVAALLRRQVTAALAAREQEAAGTGAALVDLASRLRSAAAGYQHTEESRTSRHGRLGQP